MHHLEPVAVEAIEGERDEHPHRERHVTASGVGAVAPVADLEALRVERDARMKAHAAEHLARPGEDAHHVVATRPVVGDEAAHHVELGDAGDGEVRPRQEAPKVGAARLDGGHERVNVVERPGAELEGPVVTEMEDAPRRVGPIDRNRGHRRDQGTVTEPSW